MIQFVIITAGYNNHMMTDRCSCSLKHVFIVNTFTRFYTRRADNAISTILRFVIFNTYNMCGFPKMNECWVQIIDFLHIFYIYMNNDLCDQQTSTQAITC